MREIKFREWDSVREEMYAPDNHWGLSYSSREDFDDMVGFRFRHTEGDENWGLTDSGKPGRMLEQYTGLKDANGKEIYEGDLLKYTGVIGDWFIAPVKYFGDEDYPAFDLDHKYIPSDYLFEANALSEGIAGVNLEVVGNIHENPELLEVEDD